eukprot:s154_g94.t1
MAWFQANRSWNGRGVDQKGDTASLSGVTNKGTGHLSGVHVTQPPLVLSDHGMFSFTCIFYGACRPQGTWGYGDMGDVFFADYESGRMTQPRPMKIGGISHKIEIQLKMQREAMLPALPGR